MIKWAILISFLLVPICLFGTDIKVVVSDSNNFSSAPGKVNTMLIELENTGKDTINTYINFKFPEEWKAFQNNLRVTLKPLQKVKKLISFVVPHKEIKGNHEIKYVVKNQQNQAIIFQDRIDFKIKGINKLEVVPMEVQPMSLAGSTVQSTFLIKNLSNQVQNISLVSNKGNIVGKNHMTLAAFTNQMVEVVVEMPKDVRAEGRFSFNLMAKIANSDILSCEYLHTTLLPIKEYFEEERHHLSGHTSVNYINQKLAGKDATGIQGELMVAGHIDKDAEKYIEVSLRGPNRQGNADILLYDEYYATYKTDKIAAKIGDYNYSLSRLTEFSRNARGVGVDLRFKETGIGAFAALPRFFPDVKSITGAYFTNYFNEDNSVSFNYLGKKYIQDKGNTSIMSISGLFTPFKKTIIEAEIASGQGKGKEGYAGFLSLESRLLKKVNLKAQTILASPHYDGYYRNTKSLAGNINWTIGKNIQLFANASEDNRNTALDTLFQAAPYAQREQIGVQYRWNRATYIQFSARKNSLEDRMPQKFFHRKERLLTAKIDNRYKHFGWSIQGEYGKYRNLLKQTETDLQSVLRGMLSLSGKFKHTTINIFGNYLNENSLVYEGQKQLIYGASLNARFTSSSKLNVSYQNSFALEDYYRNRNTFNFSFNQKIGKGQQLSVDVRQTLLKNTLEKKDLTVSVKYTWNFHIPLEKAAPKGGVSGFIYRGNQEPAAGILVYVDGKTAITDGNGRFKFKGLAIGTHFIIVDKSTLELHELPVSNEAIKVEVIPDEVQKITVPIVKTGMVSGQLGMKIRQAAPLKISQTSLQDYLIEIKMGAERRVTTTDEEGQFLLKDLRPGKWTLTILNPTQNKRIVFDKKIFEVDIKENQSTSIKVDIRKKQRKIRFKRIINFSDDDDDDGDDA